LGVVPESRLLSVVVLPDPATCRCSRSGPPSSYVGRGEGVDAGDETEYWPVAGADGTRVSGTPVATKVTPRSSLNVAPLATVTWKGVPG
jgi:hypothetical protein